MHILIIEDEPLASENLEKILLEVAPDIQKVSRTESIAQTLPFLESNDHQPDLIFMDIHLSDGSAFTIFNKITLDTPIIFTTAYDKYALQAFKVNSIDYLLKPIDVDQLAAAVEKFRKYNPSNITGKINGTDRSEVPDHYPEKLLVQVREELLPISLDDIVCFYATEGDTKIFKADGAVYSYPKRLIHIMSVLNPSQFFRANKQFILSKKHVTGLTIWNDNRLRISVAPHIDIPEKIYISKNRAAEFRRWIAK